MTLPELSLALEQYRTEWAPDEPGAYNFLDEIFSPTLERWLDSGTHDDELRRAFGVVESLAGEPDTEIRYWVNEFVAWLLQSDGWLARAQPLLGPRIAAIVSSHQNERSELEAGRRWWQFWRRRVG